jgi:hypothetical protein
MEQDYDSNAHFDIKGTIPSFFISLYSLKNENVQTTKSANI